MQDDKAIITDYSKRVEKNDVDAMNNLAAKYRKGQGGLTKDEVMALRLNLRAAELGSHASIYALAAHFDLFYDGDAQDAVFAMQLATIAAKKGYLESYYLLGCIYAKQEDGDNAAKCLIYAARAGHSDSMEIVRKYVVDGAKLVSDDDLEAIEEVYNEAVKLEWSEEREAFKKLSL